MNDRISDKPMANHTKVALGVGLGLLLGYLASFSDVSIGLVRDYIKPFGTIFIKMLKLVAVPLVFFSLVKGISDLKDIGKLSALGGRTIAWYLATSLLAVVIGLVLVNVFKPGVGLNIEALQELSKGVSEFSVASSAAGGPLEFFVRMVPDNLFSALGDNGKLLQVIFFALVFGLALLMLPAKQQKPIIDLIASLNAVMMKIVDMIIWVSPYAVFALMATLFIEVPDPALFQALLSYSGLMLLGMVIMLVFYPLLLKVLVGMPIRKFVQGILPAQLVALTTSSSVATLPVTMECVRDNLDVHDEVASFVCPIGATVNMDASCLLMSIASVFICQLFGFDLSLTAQLTIVFTAMMASVGAAGAPSAGIIMLVLVLESVGFPAAALPLALTLIMAVDRPLDMGRTVVNITGDSCVSVIVDAQMKLTK